MWLYGMAANTQKSYRSDLVQFRKFAGGKALADVTLRDLQGFATSLEETSLAPSSRARKLVMLRSLFQFMLIQGFRENNPARALKLPKVRNDLANRILSVEQVRSLLDAAKSRVPELPPNKEHFTLVELMQIFGFADRTGIDRTAKRHGWQSVIRPTPILSRRDNPKNKPPRYAQRVSAEHLEALLREQNKPMPDPADRDYSISEAIRLTSIPAGTMQGIFKRRGWPIRVDYATWNPTERAWIRRALKPRACYRRADVEQLIYQSPAYRDFVLLTFLYETGCRISEALGLRWRDLGRRDDGSARATLFGKGGKTRVLRLRPECWRLLATLRVSSLPADPVFRTRWRTVRALTREYFTRCLHKIAALAGLDVPVSPHWLRHCHASHSLDGGCPIHVLQAQLGHASLVSTERYIHANPDDTSSDYLPPTDPTDAQERAPILKITRPA